MKQGETTVKSEQKEIGVATYPIFDTLQEACDHETLGEEKVLELVNAQVKTNAMNTLRQSRKSPTKGWLKDEATNEITQEMCAGEHAECLGQKEALAALIGRRMVEIEARMQSERDSGGESEEDTD